MRSGDDRGPYTWAVRSRGLRCSRVKAYFLWPWPAQAQVPPLLAQEQPAWVQLGPPACMFASVGSYRSGCVCLVAMRVIELRCVRYWLLSGVIGELDREAGERRKEVDSPCRYYREVRVSACPRYGLRAVALYRQIHERRAGQERDERGGRDETTPANAKGFQEVRMRR